MQLTYFKNHRFIFLILAAIGMIKFSACSESEETSRDFDPTLFLNHSENYSLSYQDCEINSDACTYISISYPVFDLKENEELIRIRKRIETILVGDDNETVEELCEGFISDYNQFIEEESLNGENYDLQWYDERIGEIISIQKKAISIKVSFSSFYGGAHPNEYIYLRNYHPSSGDSIGLGMVFTEEALKELTILGESAFRRSKSLSKEVSLEGEGFWFDDDRFELTGNFAFTEQGLWFYYNNYEIAPYSMGASEIMLPYTQIVHLFE